MTSATHEQLTAEVEPWLQQCGSCDAALPMACTCPPGDYRAVLLKVWQAYGQERHDSDFTSAASFEITVSGCDDQTKITADLTPTELTLLTGIVEKITAASEFSCMPKMTIQPHVPSDGDQ